MVFCANSYGLTRHHCTLQCEFREKALTRMSSGSAKLFSHWYLYEACLEPAESHSVLCHWVQLQPLHLVI